MNKCKFLAEHNITKRAVSRQKLAGKAAFLRVSKRSRENKIRGKLARASETRDSRTFQVFSVNFSSAFRETLTGRGRRDSRCDFIRESRITFTLNFAIIWMRARSFDEY